MRVVLASASPRRRELLLAAGVVFEVRPCDVDEDLAAFADPLGAARELARRKALAAAERERTEGHTPALVLGADTIVALPGPDGGWKLLGKPVDEREAGEMLGRLADSRHLVATAVCVVRSSDRALFEDIERTWVSMRQLSTGEIDAYVASGEWRDKAGGYAIQEGADRFVVRLEHGGFDNVVGLPVARTLRLLAEAGGAARP